MSKIYRVMGVIVLGGFFLGAETAQGETWASYVVGNKRCSESKQSWCPYLYAIGWGFKTEKEALEAALNECKRIGGVHCGDYAENYAYEYKCVSVYSAIGLGTRTIFLSGFGNTAEEAQQKIIKENCTVDYINYTKPYAPFRDCRHIETRCAD